MLRPQSNNKNTSNEMLCPFETSIDDKNASGVAQCHWILSTKETSRIIANVKQSAFVRGPTLITLWNSIPISWRLIWYPNGHISHGRGENASSNFEEQNRVNLLMYDAPKWISEVEATVAFECLQTFTHWKIEVKFTHNSVSWGFANKLPTEQLPDHPWIDLYHYIRIEKVKHKSKSIGNIPNFSYALTPKHFQSHRNSMLKMHAAAASHPIVPLMSSQDALMSGEDEIEAKRADIGLEIVEELSADNDSVAPHHGSDRDSDGDDDGDGDGDGGGDGIDVDFSDVAMAMPVHKVAAAAANPVKSNIELEIPNGNNAASKNGHNKHKHKHKQKYKQKNKQKGYKHAGANGNEVISINVNAHAENGMDVDASEISSQNHKNKLEKLRKKKSRVESADNDNIGEPNAPLIDPTVFADPHLSYDEDNEGN